MSTPELRAAVETCKVLPQNYNIAPCYRDALTTVLSALAEMEKDAENARLKIEQNNCEPHFTCFRCNDGNTPLYCLNCANAIAAADAADREGKTP